MEKSPSQKTAPIPKESDKKTEYDMGTGTLRDKIAAVVREEKKSTDPKPENSEKSEE